MGRKMAYHHKNCYRPLTNDKLVAKLSELVDDWNNFITLTASSKEPYIQTDEDRDKLKSDIDEEMAKIDEFKNMVDEIKFENIDLFPEGDIHKFIYFRHLLINVTF